MATTIGIRELRDNLTATIRRVRAGETLEITNHGEPVAMISPVQKPTLSKLEQMIAEGSATPAKAPFGAHGPPRLRNRSGIPMEQIISEGRDEWIDRR